MGRRVAGGAKEETAGKEEWGKEVHEPRIGLFAWNHRWLGAGCG